MERISPLRLHEDNRMLGGFCLKSLLFPRHHHTTSSNTNVCSSADLIRETWAKLEKLVESKSIQPWVDSEWSFEEVFGFVSYTHKHRLEYEHMHAHNRGKEITSNLVLN
ncbi:hypothetical protein X801_09319 [Opisthorchis viverrini]|uniref:Uncharacterized protein n=1 Tax=Opisthorchis viverrini TaxID=6198 RepID=A0A1S8WKB4_OPIVI|nr:hypothetical protein X801_09319 [Opisthorchis viverrini]